MLIIPTRHKDHKRNHTGSMTQVPPSDFFTRRVCLRLDGMDDVTVRRDVAYGSPDHGLAMDVYYPPRQSGNGGSTFAEATVDKLSPAVIIVCGYPGTMEPRRTPLTYKEIGW